MAWAGITVYLAGVLTFTASLRHNSDHLWLVRPGKIAGLVVAFVAVLAYARRQFNMREWSARLNAATAQLIVAILGDGDLDAPRETFKATLYRPARPHPRTILRLLFPARADLNNELQNHIPELLGYIAEPDIDRRPLEFELAGYALMLLVTLYAVIAVLST